MGCFSPSPFSPLPPGFISPPHALLPLIIHLYRHHPSAHTHTRRAEGCYYEYVMSHKQPQDEGPGDLSRGLSAATISELSIQSQILPAQTHSNTHKHTHTNNRYAIHGSIILAGHTHTYTNTDTDTQTSIHLIFIAPQPAGWTFQQQ